MSDVRPLSAAHVLDVEPGASIKTALADNGIACDGFDLTLNGLSASGDASGLGVFPKLFVASEGEVAAADAERMVEEAPGDWNAIYLAEGDASGRGILTGDGAEEAMEAIIQRLDERR